MPIQIDDDEILDWWEDYAENGLSVTRIAAKYHRDTKTITKHLIELGAISPPEIYIGPVERRIIDALGRIDVDSLENHRHLPYANSLPHVKAAKHAVVQSRRQREQDRMASSLWRAIVRIDLQRAGLLPRSR